MKFKVGFTVTFLCVTILLSGQTELIPFGSNWKYLDNGSNQGTAWRGSTFNDASWKSGRGAFGYGESDGRFRTVINSGGSTKFITSYFRITVNIPNPAQYSTYFLNIKRDDGIVVYVNGTERVRDNMPTGTLAYNTLATTYAPDDGSSILPFPIPVSAFIAGTNTIAVEVHQSSTSSSDKTFDLQLTGQTGAVVNEVIHKWSGALRSNGVTVVAKMQNNSTNLKLVLSTSPTLSNPLFSGTGIANSANNKMVKLSYSGLQPNTTYYYAIQDNGVTDNSTDDIGSFTTPSSEAFSFRLTVGSCAYNSDHPVYDAILTKSPLFHVTTGDFHYANPNSSNIDEHRSPYETEILSKKRASNFFSKTPFAYVWDDHDYCGDNSYGAETGQANARQAYREYVPHYTLAEGTGNKPIYQSFAIGRVYFILSDLRSSRTSSSMMGSTQKEWFKNQCLFAKNNGYIIAWVSSVSFGGNTSDNWGGFKAERRELSNFFKDNNIKNLFILSGDAHMVAIDDGSNHDFSTTGNSSKYPVFQAAGLNVSGSTKGGTYSINGKSGGPFPNPSSSVGQYGVVDVTDNGGSNITIKFTGYRTQSNSSNESILVTYTFSRNLSSVTQQPVFTSRKTEDVKGIQLSWTDLPQIENIKLQKKLGEEFVTLQHVKPKVDSYTDMNPQNGKNVYRIIDGSGNILAEQNVFLPVQMTIQTFPNPANDIVNVRIEEMPEDLSVTYLLYNEKMKTQIQGSVDLKKGHNEFPINTSDLTSGLYFLHFLLNGNILTQKIVIQK
jgi:alkaline phosphatase D